MAKSRIVIIGGGFGGLAAAKKLNRPDLDVTLLDRSNHHLFQPLLYQVATGGLNPSDIAYPIRAILRKQKNVRVLLGEAKEIDVQNKVVQLHQGSLTYDYLIVATGARHSYFGNDSWSDHAPGLKSITDALEIRRRVFLAYEAAERESDPEKRKRWLTFAVIGAGPTGVELAGALAEIGHHTLAQDFRSIDPKDVRVVLVEGADRVLPPYEAKLSAVAQRSLERRGVEVLTSSFVSQIDGEGLTIGDHVIHGRTILWAAGVQGSKLGASLGVPLDRAGRVVVQPDLSIPGFQEVFVIGDCAQAASGGKMVPGVAQGAVQGGRLAAENILKLLRNRPTKEFQYIDRGSMATIGRAAAVAEIGVFKFAGFFAWLLWWLLHIMVLVDFRTRILVAFSWIWSYLTFSRGARLIVGRMGELPEFRDRPVQPKGR